MTVSNSSNLVFESDTFVNNGWYPQNYNLEAPSKIIFAKNFDILKSGEDLQRAEFIIYGKLKIKQGKMRESGCGNWG